MELENEAGNEAAFMRFALVTNAPYLMPAHVLLQLLSPPFPSTLLPQLALTMATFTAAFCAGILQCIVCFCVFVVASVCLLLC